MCLLDRAPAIHQTCRKPKIVLGQIKQSGVQVVHLEYTHREARSETVIHATTKDHGSSRVFLRCSGLHQGARLAEEKMSEERLLVALG